MLQITPEKLYSRPNVRQQRILEPDQQGPAPSPALQGGRRQQQARRPSWTHSQRAAARPGHACRCNAALAPSVAAVLSAQPLHLTPDQLQAVAALCTELQLPEPGERQRPAAPPPLPHMHDLWGRQEDGSLQRCRLSGGHLQQQPRTPSAPAVQQPRPSGRDDTGGSCIAPVPGEAAASPQGQYVGSAEQLTANVQLLVQHAAGGVAGARALVLRTPALLLSPLGPWFEFLDALGFEPSNIKGLLASCPELFCSGAAGLLVAGEAVRHLRALGFDHHGVLHWAGFYPQSLLMRSDQITQLVQQCSRFQSDTC